MNIQLIRMMDRIQLRIVLVLLVGLISAQMSVGISQEVSISSELPIRNYFSYEVLGKINDRYLVYRDKGFDKEIDVFNTFMEHTQHADLILEKRKTDMIHTLGMDTMFQLIYAYVEKDTVVMKMRRYDHKVTLIDSSTLTKIPKTEIKSRISAVLSENKQKILIYTLDAEYRLNFLLYDNERNRLLNSKKLVFPEELNVKKNLKDVVVTDKGNLLVSFYEDGNYAAETDGNLNVFYYETFSGAAGLSKIEFAKKFRRGTYLDYDNYNGNILLCGLYSDRKTGDDLGVYLLSKSPWELNIIESVNYIPFGQDLIKEVSRTKKKKSRIFQDFKVSDVVKRQDGGVLVLMELAKEFSRRSAYNPGVDNGAGVNRGWVDYYNEDIIVNSINPNNTIDWSQILYKKQFSQDDNAIFSSFFVMKTPSRMRLLYNDEIKKNNTVSEYLIDPAGQVARNSLLSTEDQALKLRFRDAIQVSNSELIVPSENNYKLNLVKIQY